ncbi:MAG: FtsX-like permease family protein [Bacteroidota bacterium]
MSFERTVAARYLWDPAGPPSNGRGEGEQGFLRFVTGVAVVGVAVGVAALLLALMIVHGFSREIEAKIVGVGADVQVTTYLSRPVDRADTLQVALEGREKVAAAVPIVADFALLRSSNDIDGVQLIGMPEDGQPFLQERILKDQGVFAFEADSVGRPGIVIGSKLAALLGAEVGQPLTAFSTRSLGQSASGSAAAFGTRPAVRQFYLAGVFETGLAEFDELFAYTDLDAARRLFRLAGDEVMRFDLRLHEPERATEVARVLSADLGVPFSVRSIYDLYPNLFAWVDLQQSIIPLVIGTLVLIGAFNIVGALLMLLLEKSREIGILLGMGASRKRVRRLFLWLGLLIGGAGACIGALLALGLGLLQLRFGLIPLPQDAYYLDTAPIELRALDFVIVTALTLLLCVLAAYLPARAAARIEPIRTIRFGG